MNKYFLLTITDLAKAEISQAVDYIAVELENPSAAKKPALELKKKIQAIPIFPYSYPDCTIYSIHDKQYRHLILGNYILIFHIDEGSRTIEILRFVYGKTDIDRTEL